MKPFSLTRLSLIAPVVAMSGLLISANSASAAGVGSGNPKITITAATAAALNGVTPSTAGDIALNSNIQLNGGSKSYILNIASVLTATDSANILARNYQDPAQRVCVKFTTDFKAKAQRANYDISFITTYSTNPISMPIPFVVNGREVYKFNCDLRTGGSSVAITPPAPPKPSVVTPPVVTTSVPPTTPPTVTPPAVTPPTVNPPPSSRPKPTYVVTNFGAMPTSYTYSTFPSTTSKSPVTTTVNIIPKNPHYPITLTISAPAPVWGNVVTNGINFNDAYEKLCAAFNSDFDKQVKNYHGNFVKERATILGDRYILISLKTALTSKNPQPYRCKLNWDIPNI